MLQVTVKGILNTVVLGDQVMVQGWVRGKQNTLAQLVRKGLISQEVADKMLEAT